MDTLDPTQDARPQPEMDTGDGMIIDSASWTGIAAFKGHKIKWPHKVDRKNHPCHYELRILHRHRVIFHADALTTTEFELTAADLYHITEELRTYSLGDRLPESVNLHVCLRAHYEKPVPAKKHCAMVTEKLTLTFKPGQRIGQVY